MKKAIIIFLLSLSILFTLSGCREGKKTSKKDEVSEIETEVVETKEEIEEIEEKMEVHESSEELDSEDETNIEIEESQGAGGL